MPEAGTLAREYYDKAVTGDVEAQHALAKCYATADGGVGRDMSASFDWDLKAARNGNGDAMYAVGCRYAEGIEGVVTQDYGEALRWWRKAAEVGDLSGDAHYKIAECYIYGWGIGKNEYKASDWFLLSAGRGNLMAQIWLGRTALDEGRATEGVKWLKKAALQGSPIAQVQLGRAYMDGLDGVKQDNSEALMWFKMAAEQEWPEGLYLLGTMYLIGKGCAMDTEEAFRLIRLSAEQGYVHAHFNLAQHYFYGRDVVKNLTEAERWCRRPAEDGMVIAQTLMGCILYEQERKAEAAGWWEKAAGQGDVFAVLELGKYYIYDLNDYRAIPYLEKAADLGCGEAECLLGWCYLNGWGVTADKDKARSLLESAVGHGVEEEARRELSRIDKEIEPDIKDIIYNAVLAGDAAARHELAVRYATGDHVPRDMAESVKWDKKSAEQGNAAAQYSLGCRYANGEGGLDKDMDEALRWWRKAAEQGIQDAYCRIGECYGEGNGVLRNAYTAVEYFKKAADKGHSYAQYSLASVYLLMGLTEEAAKYFEKAAEQGNAEAQFNLARMYYFCNGVKQDYAETVKWLEKAAEYDYWPAVYALGYCYILGEGVPESFYNGIHKVQEAAENGLEAAQVSMADYLYVGEKIKCDYAKALEWYKKAAEQGNDYSMYQIGLFYERGLGVSKDLQQARYWYKQAEENGNVIAAEAIVRIDGQ